MERVDVAVVGAGVVGLSVAAHLAAPRQEPPPAGAPRVLRTRDEQQEQRGHPRQHLLPPGLPQGTAVPRGQPPHVRDLQEARHPAQEHGQARRGRDPGRGGPCFPGFSRRPSATAPKGSGSWAPRRSAPSNHGSSPWPPWYCPTSGVVDSHALMQHFRALAANCRRYGGLWRGCPLHRQDLRRATGLVSGSGRAPRFEFETSRPRELRRPGRRRGGRHGRHRHRRDPLPHLLPEGDVLPCHPRARSPSLHADLPRAPDRCHGGHPHLPGPGGRHAPRALRRLGGRGGIHRRRGPRETSSSRPCRPFLPTLERGGHPARHGRASRPSGTAPASQSRDFVIRDEADRGLPGLINLVGIESPGLTSSPAIGRLVSGLVEDALSR